MAGIGFIHMCEREGSGSGDMSASVLYICYKGKSEASRECKRENVCLTRYDFSHTCFHTTFLHVLQKRFQLLLSDQGFRDNVVVIGDRLRCLTAFIITEQMIY